MGHSVAQHLSVSLLSYDVAIRKLVPFYEEAQAQVLDALSDLLFPEAKRVMDVGAGTGRVTERMLARFPHLRFVVLDADPEILDVARRRLVGELPRLEFRRGSFFEPLPQVDAQVASLSLHHVKTLEEKRAVYVNLRASLNEGGVLINADAAVPEVPALRDAVMKRWADHLEENGDTRAEAFERFASWAREERYFSVEQELALMREAGFSAVEVRWRKGPLAVVTALK